jgi:hypothetical protein
MNKFKKQWNKMNKATDEAEKAIGIADAGSIPNSLLARQDLETTQKSEDKKYKVEIEFRKKNEPEWQTVMYEVMARSDDEAKNMACELFNNEYNMITTAMGDLQPMPYNQCYMIRGEGVNIKKSIKKGVIEQTSKKLEDLVEDASKVNDKKEKSALVDKIAATQEKRQNAIINARKHVSGFKEFWTGNKK